jgi:hypothetical protein
MAAPPSTHLEQRFIIVIVADPCVQLATHGRLHCRRPAVVTQAQLCADEDWGLPEAACRNRRLDCRIKLHCPRAAKARQGRFCGRGRTGRQERKQGWGMEGQECGIEECSGQKYGSSNQTYCCMLIGSATQTASLQPPLNAP